MHHGGVAEDGGLRDTGHQVGRRVGYRSLGPEWDLLALPRLARLLLVGLRVFHNILVILQQSLRLAVSVRNLDAGDIFKAERVLGGGEGQDKEEQEGLRGGGEGKGGGSLGWWSYLAVAAAQV